MEYHGRARCVNRLQVDIVCKRNNIATNWQLERVRPEEGTTVTEGDVV
jgi:hypothetical protein